jgi:hypothetical protein
VGVSSSTWDNYENGVTVPGEIILKLIVLTSVAPRWLLSGEGEKFRPYRIKPGDGRCPEPLQLWIGLSEPSSN